MKIKTTDYIKALEIECVAVYTPTHSVNSHSNNGNNETSNKSLMEYIILQRKTSWNSVR